MKVRELAALVRTMLPTPPVRGTVLIEGDPGEANRRAAALTPEQRGALRRTR